MTDLQAFAGTPDDWWEQAERIQVSEANNRSLGAWYITKQKTAGQTKAVYRLMTPSRPPSMDQLLKSLGPHNRESDSVRCLMRLEMEMPAWMTSQIVIADTGMATTEGKKMVQRLPWVRKNSGRWQSLFDGRRNINDHEMAELNPAPARITEDN
jgi:hypothetical protein